MDATTRQLLEHAETLLDRHRDRPSDGALIYVMLGGDHRSYLYAQSTVTLPRTAGRYQIILSSPLKLPHGRLRMSWTTRTLTDSEPDPTIDRHIPHRARWEELPEPAAEREAALDVYHALVADGMHVDDAFEIAILL